MLVTHRGAVRVERAELENIPVPQETPSYKPVSHHQLTDTILTIGQDLLTDYTLVGEDYAISRQGQQLFACLKFQNKKSFDIAHTEMAMSVAYRNSLDKSMSIGMAIGAQVFVCDNMALRGDICVMKKHTLNVWQGLENLAIQTFYKAQKNHQLIIQDSERLKRITLDNNQAYQQMGVLFGNGIVSPRQLPVLRQNWLRPQHEDFQPRTMWSLYNSATESLKSCPPMTIIEKHQELHKLSEGWR